MSAVFNIVIIGMVGLIAYWWANQGLFSAILHLLCVIAAGAIALAIWEPLVTKLLLHNSFFDNYAWGLGLVVPFTVILLLVRMVFDKSIGSNVELPRWANLSFGLVVGAMAGVLTVGIFVIGAGFIHSHREIMGFTGYARSREHKAQIVEVESMWLPVHTLTADFYSMLSAGALYPTFDDTPMKQLYPDLQRESVSLHRDSFDNGKGKTTLKPSDATVGRLIYCDTCSPKRYGLEVTFEGGARDFGEQFTLSSSQVHLIGQASGFNDPKIAFPVEFTQYSGHHKFDDISHYISSEPGQQRAVVILEFNAADLGTQPPRYVMIKGTRYRMPRQGTAQWVNVNPATYAETLQSGASAPTGLVEIAPNGRDLTSAIKQTTDIRPVEASINKLPSGIQTLKVGDKNWISGGDGEFFNSGGERPGKGLGLSGIWQQPGTSLVQVDVGRSSNANIFRDSLQLTANSDDPSVMLVDSKNRPYYPVGYIWTQPNGKTRIHVDYESTIRKMSDVPQLPTSDTHKLRLLFAVTNGSTIAGLKVGDATVGTCNILVDDPDKLKASRPAPVGGAEGTGG